MLNSLGLLADTVLGEAGAMATVLASSEAEALLTALAARV